MSDISNPLHFFHTTNFIDPTGQQITSQTGKSLTLCKIGNKKKKSSLLLELMKKGRQLCVRQFYHFNAKDPDRAAINLSGSNTGY